MDKKIIKYKFKKNKLEDKIIDILNLKKEYYENKIINSNNNEIITEGVENFYNKIKLNQEEHLVIIIFGFYSVGKSTFISYLENYIQMIEKNSLLGSEIKKLKTCLVQKITIGSNGSNGLNDIEHLKDLDFSSKITIIECDIDDIIKINSSMSGINIINVNIIPKSANTLKNKIINKIIVDIKTGYEFGIGTGIGLGLGSEISKFISFIKNKKIIEDEKINNIYNGINLLKMKNVILDDDFIFIDEIANQYYMHIINFSLPANPTINFPLDAHKYYL